MSSLFFMLMIYPFDLMTMMMMMMLLLFFFFLLLGEIRCCHRKGIPCHSTILKELMTSVDVNPEQDTVLWVDLAPNRCLGSNHSLPFFNGALIDTSVDDLYLLLVLSLSW